MIQELLVLLPAELTRAMVALCVIALVAGVLLWVTGAVWSRAFLTLVAVAIGASLGMLVPRWQLWPINSMAGAVLGAVGLGVSAFLFERMWIGLTLGFVLALWAGLGTWMHCQGRLEWQPPAVWEVSTLTPPQQAEYHWSRLPDQVRKLAPYATGMGMLSGLAIAMLWPRAGRTLCFSALGVSVMFASALALVAAKRTDWLAHVPEPAVSQAGVLAGLVLVGALAQWQLVSSPAEEVNDDRSPVLQPAQRFV